MSSCVITLNQLGQPATEHLRVSWEERSRSSRPPHVHRFHLFVLLRSVTGPTLWAAGSHRAELTSGDIIFWPAGLSGQLQHAGDIDALYVGLMPESPRQQEVFAPVVCRDDLLTHLGHAAGEVVRRGPQHAPRVAESLGSALSAHAQRYYLQRAAQGDGLARPVLRAEGLSSSVLQRVEAWIESNLSGDLRVARLAEVAGLSTYHFARGFRASTGQSPHRFVVSRRVERARSFLDQGMPIAEAAFRSGFSSQSHLGLHFRRQLGVPPGVYVRRQVGMLRSR